VLLAYTYSSTSVPSSVDNPAQAHGISQLNSVDNPPVGKSAFHPQLVPMRRTAAARLFDRLTLG